MSSAATKRVGVLATFWPSSGNKELIADEPPSGVRLVVPREAPPRGARDNAPSSPSAIPLYNEKRMATGDPLKPLADAARSGDPVATRRLLEALGPTLLGVVRAILGRDHRDIEDVLQESLVGVVHALASFRGDSSVLHFARSIALRRALDHRRSRARRAPEVVIDDEPILDDAGSPAASAVSTRRRLAFRAMLEELRPEQAEAFAQRVLFEYSVEEIATQTGAPIDTVKSRLRLAKAALRGRIQNDPTLLELSETVDDDAP